ncbi:MAG: ATP-binding protein [Phycisphaerae bacterium]
MTHGSFNPKSRTSLPIAPCCAIVAAQVAAIWLLPAAPIAQSAIVAALAAVNVWVVHRHRATTDGSANAVHSIEDARFRGLVEQANIVLWEFDCDASRFTYVSPAAAAMLGYPLGMWYEPNFWQDHIHPDDRQPAMQFCEAQVAADRAHRFQYRMIAADARHVWVDDLVYQPEHVGARTILRGVLVDDSARAIAELELRSTTAALEEAQALARSGNWSWELPSGAIKWSQQVYRMFGHDASQPPLAFGDALQLYADEDAARLDAAVCACAAQGAPFSLTLRTRHGHNGCRYVRSEGRAKRDGSGRVISLHGTVTDVTSEVERELALRQAQVEVAAASQSKSEFLANMSHEIRTPMTAILGYAELLADDGDRTAAPVRRLEHIETIRRNGEHLLAIINDILDISKIEAGKLNVEAIPTRLDHTIHDVLSLMSIHARAKGLLLQATFETPIPAAIRTDPVRLRQILTNLLGNAIKFTERGVISVRVSMAAHQPELVRIDVCDTGIGLTDEQKSRLFGAFVQADASTTRRYGGSGLGLHVSRRLAQLLGGELSVESTPGVGSTFTVTIAAGDTLGIEMIEPGELRVVNDREPSDGAAASLINAAREPLAGVSILLVEDGPDNQRLIAFHLRKAGARVMVADNGRRGIEMLTDDGTLDGSIQDPLPVDMILTDMQMPEMDGYVATRLLRERGVAIPIVALTAHAMAGDGERCIEAGCDEYATKPINRATLIDICIRAARRGGVVRTA